MGRCENRTNNYEQEQQMKLRMKQRNEPVIDMTYLVFNRRRTLRERFREWVCKIFGKRGEQ